MCLLQTQVTILETRPQKPKRLEPLGAPGTFTSVPACTIRVEVKGAPGLGSQSWIPVRACCRTRLRPGSCPDRPPCGFQTDKRQWSKQSCLRDLVSQVFLSLSTPPVWTRSTSGQCWHPFSTRWRCNHACVWTARNQLNYGPGWGGEEARMCVDLDLRFLNFDFEFNV